MDIFQNLQELERCLFFLVGISKRENLLCIETRQIGFAVSVINRLQSYTKVLYPKYILYKLDTEGPLLVRLHLVQFTVRYGLLIFSAKNSLSKNPFYIFSNNSSYLSTILNSTIPWEHKILTIRGALYGIWQLQLIVYAKAYLNQKR